MQKHLQKSHPRTRFLSPHTQAQMQWAALQRSEPQWTKHLGVIGLQYNYEMQPKYINQTDPKSPVFVVTKS